MTGLNLAALLIATFAVGAYAALVVRALFAARSHQRISDAAEAALGADDLARLRAYIAVVDERAAMTLKRDGGSTHIHFPPTEARRPVGPPPKPSDARQSVRPAR